MCEHFYNSDESIARKDRFVENTDGKRTEVFADALNTRIKQGDGLFRPTTQRRHVPQGVSDAPTSGKVAHRIQLSAPPPLFLLRHGWMDALGGAGYDKSMKVITLSTILQPEDDGYVSLCPELDIASQGDTIESALANLKEALAGFFETASPEEVKRRLKKPVLFTHVEVACA